MKKLFLTILIFKTLVGFSQIKYDDFITSSERTSYPKVHVNNRTFVPNAPLIEANVKYTKRVIRCIDTRQKMNKPLDWPRNPLNKLLTDNILNGNIIPYKNDSLSSSFTITNFQDRGRIEIVSSYSIDPEDPTNVIDTVIYEQLDYSKIKKFWVMEEWNFDSKHSVLKPKIIAIAPIFSPTYAGFQANEQPLCWILMDEVRHILSRSELFNRYNDAARLSYDDFFQMRIFDSYIVFENNVYDQYINQFEEYEDNGVAALIKSDEIKNDIFIFEHDLWQF